MLDAFDVGNQNACPPLPPLLFRRIQIPNAAVKTSFSTPIVLIPAMGATKGIFPEAIQLHKPAGVAFAGGMTNTQILWTGSPTFIFNISMAGFLDTAAKATLHGIPGTQASYNFDVHFALNTDVVYRTAGADPTTGTSDLFIALTYRIWELAPPTWL